jgi:molecular chaperone GrpE
MTEANDEMTTTTTSSTTDELAESDTMVSDPAGASEGVQEEPVEQSDNPSGTAETEQAESDSAESGLAASRIRQLEQEKSELEQKLIRESEQAMDYMNRYQRLQADFANFKRRAQQEQEQHEQLAVAHVISLFLPALDSFERAFATLPASLRSYSWIDGITLVLMEMQRALQFGGVNPIEVEPGHAFDPLRHESVGEVESSDFPPGYIAVVLQSGYEVGGRTLRPTLVQLAKQAVPQADEQSGDGAAGTGETSSDSQDNDQQ